MIALATVVVAEAVPVEALVIRKVIRAAVATLAMAILQRLKLDTAVRAAAREKAAPAAVKVSTISVYLPR